MNAGDHDKAYNLLSPRIRSQVSKTEWAAGQVTSYLFDIHITSVTRRAPGTDIARVRFTSVQDSAYGHDGQTCSNWRLTYTMLHRNSRWLIDQAVAAPGTPRPC